MSEQASNIESTSLDGDLPTAEELTKIDAAVASKIDAAPPDLQSISEIIARLSKPIPPEFLKTKTIGGAAIKFIPWYTVNRILEKVAPGFSYEIRSISSLVGNKVCVVARISIPCKEGIVYREATGQEAAEIRGYGDSSSNAESMAFRRAAAKFGLGLSLYGGAA